MGAGEGSARMVRVLKYTSWVLMLGGVRANPFPAMRFFLFRGKLPPWLSSAISAFQMIFQLFL